jgi:hypothetical protein
MRRSISRGAMGFAFVVVLAGCQLLTGTYSAGSSSGSCSALASCCSSLSGTNAAACQTYVAEDEDQVCAAYLQAECSIKLDGGSDTGIQQHDSSPGPDGPVAHPDANGGHDAFQSHDVSQGHDHFVGHDTSAANDTGKDTSMPDLLDGTWSLSDIQCDGESDGVDGSATLTFSGSNVTETDTTTDGCAVTLSVSSASVSETDITADDGSVSCGSACTASDDCTGGETGTIDWPYTLSSGTLTLNLPDSSGSCDTGTLSYIWTQD